MFKNTLSLIILSFILVSCSRVSFESTPEFINSLKVHNPIIFINNDSEYTNNKKVSLILQAHNADEMYVSNNPECFTGGKWEPVKFQKNWTLKHENSDTKVFVKFRNKNEYESPCISDSIVHDNIPPSAQLNKRPLKLTNKSSVFFQFEGHDSGSGIDQLYCTFNNYATGPCTSGVFKSHAKEGQQSFKLSAVDKAGNKTTLPSYLWELDTTPPDTQLVNKPNLYSPHKQAHFRVQTHDLNEVHKFECSINSNSKFQKCKLDFRTPVLSEGSHQFYYRSTDKVGNTSQVKVYHWKTDYTSPSLSWKEVPQLYSHQKIETLSFDAKDQSPLMHYCKISNHPFQSCQNLLKTPKLNEGQQEVKIYSIDKAGNKSSTLSYQWVSDFTPPNIEIKNLPESMTNKTTGYMRFYISDSMSPLKSYSCQFNNKAFPCENNKTIEFTHLKVGTYNFSIEAVDEAENRHSQNFQWEVRQHLNLVNNEFHYRDHGQLDLLFVMDNSISMTEEQKKMSQRFSKFLPYINDLNWQLAITTTDIQPYGHPYQDGRLVPFGNSGHYWLSSELETHEANRLFKSTIQRNESGSGEESGLGGTLRALERFESKSEPHLSFFRKTSHLDVIVVTDENENVEELKAEPFLIKRKVKKLWPQKNFRFHSIVVKSNDERCDSIYGHEAGVAYEELSRLTEGIIGSVCTKDYASHLSQIGENIRSEFKKIKLKCTPWDSNNDQIPDVEFISEFTPPLFTVVNNHIVFDQLVPLGKFRLKYSCPEY